MCSSDLMIRRPPRATRNRTLFPYTTLFRSRQPLLDLANVVRPTNGGMALRLTSDRPGGPQPRLMRCYDAAGEARLVADAILDVTRRGNLVLDLFLGSGTTLGSRADRSALPWARHRSGLCRCGDRPLVGEDGS